MGSSSGTEQLNLIISEGSGQTVMLAYLPMFCILAVHSCHAYLLGTYSVAGLYLEVAYLPIQYCILAVRARQAYLHVCLLGTYSRSVLSWVSSVPSVSSRPLVTIWSILLWYLLIFLLSSLSAALSLRRIALRLALGESSS